MIIKLTQAEVHKYVSVALNLSLSLFTIEITDCAPSASQQAFGILQALRLAVLEFPLHQSTQKIACIKRFRDLAPRVVYDGGMTSVIGLADAKWAVENVAVAIRNLELTGKLQ